MSELYKSPVGVLRYPHLLVPHTWKDSGDAPKYETTLRLFDAVDAEPFADQLDAWRA